MTSTHSYQRILETSRRVNWDLGALFGETRCLDFARPFLPESLARTEPLVFLSAAEKLKLNHIRARGYLALFELVEAFVVTFVAQRATERLRDEPFRSPALENFVAEEEKHRRLFGAMLREFDARFGTPCGLIGPAEDICRAILSHAPVAVAITILGLEWMSQGHYLQSIKDDHDLDPQFKNLLKHHWIEEAQHAKLDALLLEQLARELSPQAAEAALQEYFEIGSFLDAGLQQQATFDLESLEKAVGRVLAPAERQRFLQVQHAALRWTFLGTAMLNPNFLAALSAVSGAAARRVEQAGSAFASH